MIHKQSIELEQINPFCVHHSITIAVIRYISCKPVGELKIDLFLCSEVLQHVLTFLFENSLCPFSRDVVVLLVAKILENHGGTERNFLSNARGVAFEVFGKMFERLREVIRSVCSTSTKFVSVPVGKKSWIGTEQLFVQHFSKPTVFGVKSTSK